MVGDPTRAQTHSLVAGCILAVLPSPGGALDELRAQIAPLPEIWTREAAEAYRVEQAKWEQSAAALSEILFSLGNAVRDGADDAAATDRSAANAWGR